MRRIKTALLSYGLSGKVFHAPFLQVHQGYELVGSWERSRRQIATDFPECSSFGSLNEILADPEIELVVVNTPTNTHFEFTRAALLAGKHVVVEKAFTTTASEAKELGQLAEERGRLISVYQNRRWDSDFLSVQKVLKNDLTGELVEAQISFDRFNPAIGPKLHREAPGPGAGNLMDLGPHCVDAALVLFGMPDAVFADLRSVRKDSLVDDYFDVLLYYKFLRVRLHSTYLARRAGPGFIVHGRAGTYVKSQSNIQEAQLRSGMKPNDVAFGIEPPESRGKLYRKGKEGYEVIESPRGNYLAYFEQLHLALNGKCPVPVTAGEGVNVMRVLEAAAESSAKGRVVSLL